MNPRFALILEAMPNGGPVDNRLRSALKMLRRAYGMRCVRVVEMPQEEQKTDGNVEGDESTNLPAVRGENP